MAKPPYSSQYERTLKPVEWIASSLDDLKRFPQTVQARMGFALFNAQAGNRHRHAKILKGFGAGVLEVVSRHDGDTFRAVYTVRFSMAVYVLHAFQKKAKKGISTPKRDTDIVRQRLKAAELHYEVNYDGTENKERR